MKVEEFDLLTSIPACLYIKYGLNDTLTFSLDSQSQIINAFSYEVIDSDYLATLEKNPRKKRLLTTRQYEEFSSKAKIIPYLEGNRPLFTKADYDSQGKEVRVQKLGQEGAGEPEEEQSFLRKYWLYILLAFLILPNILGVEDNQEGGGSQGGQGGGGGQAPRR